MTAPAADGQHNQADVMFARMMIPHHEQAIEMAKLAPTRANSTDVKALAAQIQAAQQPEINEMKGWLSAWGEPTMPAGVGQGAGGPGRNARRDDGQRRHGQTRGSLGEGLRP
jgi:uncharacterized protein (DUF305 family)